MILGIDEVKLLDKISQKPYFNLDFYHLALVSTIGGLREAVKAPHSSPMGPGA